jgi:DNA-binding response OmpR family regulator
MFNILLLEDDEILSQSLQIFLEDSGYSVTIAKNGEDAINKSFDREFDLYLLDVNVPLLNGFDFLSQLRESGDRTPAFFLTALVDIESLSKGFDVGCDDYIKKPFDVEELLVRINAISKRKSSTLKYANIEFDFVDSTLKKDGILIDLGYIESLVFELFIKNIGKVVTKEQFFDVMQKPTDTGLRVHINKLKNLLDLHITNIRGVGYRLEEV